MHVMRQTEMHWYANGLMLLEQLQVISCEGIPKRVETDVGVCLDIFIPNHLCATNLLSFKNIRASTKTLACVEFTESIANSFVKVYRQQVGASGLA